MECYLVEQRVQQLQHDQAPFQQRNGLAHRVKDALHTVNQSCRRLFVNSSLEQQVLVHRAGQVQNLMPQERVTIPVQVLQFSFYS